MLKKVINLIFVLLFLFPVAYVEADTYPTIETDWKVVFKNKKLTSNYDENVIAEALKGMQPGDDAVLEFTLVNEYSSSVGWWVSNDVIKSFEEKSKANGGAYAYLLEYVDPNNDKVTLYSSESVGGENTEFIGLHGATNALDNYFYLGDIPARKTAVVRLHVWLDGETQNNSYQDTLAELQINFAVELPDERFIIPKTGVFSEMLDDLFTGSHVNPYIISSIVSFLLIIVLSAYLYINRKMRTVR